jgi:hypothetical protein
MQRWSEFQLFFQIVEVLVYSLLLFDTPFYFFSEGQFLLRSLHLLRRILVSHNMASITVLSKED